LGTVHEDLNRFTLMTTLRNILLLYNSAKGIHSCVSIEILNNYISLTSACMSVVLHREGTVASTLLQRLLKRVTILRYTYFCVCR